MRLEEDLSFVFIGDLPLVLQGDAGVVLDRESLLARDSGKGGGIEELRIVSYSEMGLVTVTNEVEALDVRSRVVEDTLGCEVIEAGLLREEFETD